MTKSKAERDLDRVREEYETYKKETESRLEEYHGSSMELAMGLSECFGVLQNISAGSYESRVSEEVLASSDDLIAALGKALNDTVATVENQVELVMRQQSVIHELSTPVLQLWDDILVLPIIGVVDTSRSAEIMERLLTQIVSRQARYVIMDITGVDVVDTRTADHFIKMIKAAELLGTTCVLSGIQPAVAQTLVDVGVDLSSILTLRDLSESLKECLRQKDMLGDESGVGVGERTRNRDARYLTDSDR